MTRSSRFEFRLSAADKQAINQAAAHCGLTPCEFARQVAVEKARSVLTSQHKTVVPSDYFDALMAELAGEDAQ